MELINTSDSGSEEWGFESLKSNTFSYMWVALADIGDAKGNGYFIFF